MKKFFTILSLSAILLLGSCTADKFNPDQSAKLKEVVMAGDSLSQDDYSRMITQMESCISYVHSKMKKADDAEKMNALLADSTFQDRLQYAVGFSFVLRQHRNDFDPATLEQYDKAMAKADKYGFDPFRMAGYVTE